MMKLLEITRGGGEDEVLWNRYAKEGFGLETVFEKAEWVSRWAEGLYLA